MTRRWSQDCSLIGDALTLFQLYCSELLIKRKRTWTHVNTDALHVEDLVISTLKIGLLLLHDLAQNLSASFRLHEIVCHSNVHCLYLEHSYNHYSYGVSHFSHSFSDFFFSLYLLLVSSSKYISIFTCSRHMPNSFNWCLDFLLCILHRNSCFHSLYRIPYFHYGIRQNHNPTGWLCMCHIFKSKKNNTIVYIIVQNDTMKRPNLVHVMYCLNWIYYLKILFIKHVNTNRLKCNLFVEKSLNTIESYVSFE